MEIINPPSWVKPVGYSNGVKASGTFLAVAGQVGWDEKGKLVGDDFARQFGRALANVVEVVRAAGGRAENVIKLTLFVTSKEEYLGSLKALGAEYRRVMGRHYPAMSCVQVAGLVEPGAKVEIEGLAVL
ncbi:MAG: RidA family protein [Planctomycetes bacterium]|nr:RidA family protein [Planctomycetota bacterium]